MYQLVLASESPRRKQLLETNGFVFDVVPVKVSEIPDKNLNIDEQILDIASRKAKAAFALLAEESIKASDEAIKLGKWPNSKWARRIEMFRKGPENEKVRSSVRTFMGASWTKRVLGF